MSLCLFNCVILRRVFYIPFPMLLLLPLLYKYHCCFAEGQCDSPGLVCVHTNQTRADAAGRSALMHLHWSAECHGVHQYFINSKPLIPWDNRDIYLPIIVDPCFFMCNAQVVLYCISGERIAQRQFSVVGDGPSLRWPRRTT